MAVLKNVNTNPRDDRKASAWSVHAGYKRDAVRAGQAMAVVAKVLGMPRASVGNWVRLAARGQLDAGVAEGKVVKVSPEQMELTCLRAEHARLSMERDIAKRAAAYFAQDTPQGALGFTK